MSTDLPTSVSNTLVLRNSDQSINTDGHTSCSCVNIVHRDKCADGQTRFGEACIVAEIQLCFEKISTCLSFPENKLTRLFSSKIRIVIGSQHDRKKLSIALLF